MQRPWGRGARLGCLRSRKEAGVEQTRVTGEETWLVGVGGRGGQIMRSLTGRNITLAFILSAVRSRGRGFGEKSHDLVHVFIGSLWLLGQEYSEGGKGRSHETRQEAMLINEEKTDGTQGVVTVETERSDGSWMHFKSRADRSC